MPLIEEPLLVSYKQKAHRVLNLYLLGLSNVLQRKELDKLKDGKELLQQ